MERPYSFIILGYSSIKGNFGTTTSTAQCTAAGISQVGSPEDPSRPAVQAALCEKKLTTFNDDIYIRVWKIWYPSTHVTNFFRVRKIKVCFPILYAITLLLSLIKLNVIILEYIQYDSEKKWSIVIKKIGPIFLMRFSKLYKN